MITAVIASVGFDDLLDITLPFNKAYLDRIIVVTSYEDNLTRKCCRKHDIHWIATNVWYKNGDIFNKARGLNVVLNLINKLDWVLSLDADILLPAKISTDNLDKNNIYFANRNFCDKDNFDKFIIELDFTKNYISDLHINIIEKYRNIPFCGYFQLWNQSINNVRFPTHFPTAGDYDTYFSAQWDNSRKVVLDKYVMHIGIPGMDWKGRRQHKWNQNEQHQK